MCILLLLCLCTPNLLLNLPPFSRMLYIFLYVSKSMSLFLLYMFLLFSSHPERCLLTRFRVSFLQFLPLLQLCAFSACFRATASFLGLAVRTAPTPYTLRHVSVSRCHWRLLISSYVSVCNLPLFSPPLFLFSYPFCHFLPKLYLSHFLMFQV